MSWRAQAALALLLLFLVCLSRTPSFFRSVVDWDESLYFLMASAWRAGHLPYTTIWDNKPAGIYGIFALFQAVFGGRVIAIRIAAALFVTLDAFAVFKIVSAFTRPVARGTQCAIFAALVFCLCALSNDGLSSNTELFMAAFTALAVLAALSSATLRPSAGGLLTGMLLGCAFMVKYVAVFEAPAVFLLLLSRQPRRGMAAAGAASLVGAALPLLAVALLYWHAGEWEVWWSDSIVSNLRRLAPPVPPGALAGALHQQVTRWGPLYAVALAVPALAAWRAVRAGALAPSVTPLFISLWLAGGVVGICAAKSFYDHYFLQILPALCVAAGWLLAQLGPRVQRDTGARAGLTLLLATMLLPPASAAAQALRDLARPVLVWRAGLPHWQPDAQASLAAALAPALRTCAGGAGHPALYVFDAQPILYALLRQTPPTRYVLPSELTGQRLSNVAGVDAPAEVARILAELPCFIVQNQQEATGPNADKAVFREVGAALSAHYRLWRAADGITTYRLNPQPASTHQDH